jgi:ribose transport system ATP-binding protein
VYDTPPTPTNPSAANPRGSMPAAGVEPLIRVRGLRRRFGGTVALADVDLDLHRGSILALLGQNGAGKSTLIKILAGVYPADGGEVTVAGHPLGSEAATRAMSFIHQDLGLVEWMTVAENVALGAGFPRRAGLISWRDVRRRCADALRVVAGHLDPDTLVADLTGAERSLVAIARALSAKAAVIVLDEPTASLPAADCATLFEVLRALRDAGHGIVYVSHRLDEVYAVADTVAVLRDGRLVTSGRTADHDPARLVRAIVGHEPVSYRAVAGAGGAEGADAPVLRLTDVHTDGCGPVSLDLRPGEVLGMVGLTGAGHMELGRALAGARPIRAGKIHLAGQPYRPRTVAAAVAAGVGFVTSNRQEEGCALDLTVRENLLANPRVRGIRALRWLRPAGERAAAAELIGRFAVRPGDSEATIATLSGGNQQKVMIGRWLGIRRRLVILEEPTAGVDVGAKAEIYHLLDAALAAGLAVLFISTDFEEVANVCHRALVFGRGTVTAQLAGNALSVTELTRTASALPATAQAVTGR